MTLTLSRIWVKTQCDLRSHKCVRLRTCFSLETTANKLPCSQPKSHKQFAEHEWPWSNSDWFTRGWETEGGDSRNVEEKSKTKNIE